MRFGSVCSGIEAASVAWNPLGWKAAFFSEIEPFPCAVLAHHYPDVPNLGDMTKFKDWPDANFDVLCGGTPCQSFSVAGLRKGLADPRGNLMLTFGAIADRYRPNWLVWENVPGVLSSNSGRDFGSFLGLLGELGYGFAYRVLDAQYAGLAQRRKRVFVVANLGSWQRAAAVLFERHSLSGNPAPSRKAGQGAAAGALRSTDGGSDHTHATAGHLMPQAFGGNNCSGPVSISSALSAHGGSGRMDFESETFVTHALTVEGFDASEDETGRGTPLVPIPFDTTQITSATNRSSPKAGDPCHPLAKSAHPPAIAFDCKASGRSGFSVGEIASTMRAMGHASSHMNGGGHQAVLSSMRVRRLTPRECARLQGFPDDYLDITVRGKPAADGPKYKALGNSWATHCVSWIGRRIELVDSYGTERAA